MNWEESREVGIEVEEDGKDVVYQAEITLYWCREQDYGADADGNRGAEMLFLNDYRIEIVTDLRGNPVKLTKEMEDVIDDFMEDIEPLED